MDNEWSFFPRILLLRVYRCRKPNRKRRYLEYLQNSSFPYTRRYTRNENMEEVAHAERFQRYKCFYTWLPLRRKTSTSMIVIVHYGSIKSAFFPSGRPLQFLAFFNGSMAGVSFYCGLATE